MKYYIKYILALLLFGTNGIVASYISLSSYEIVYLRVLIGGLFLILLFKVTGGKFHVRQYKRDCLFIVLSGIAMGTGWLFLYEAYQLIGVSFASLLYYCGPVIVMAVSPVIFKERLTLFKIVGFITVLTGVFLITGKTAVSGSSYWGLICGMMSAVLYAVLLICNKLSVHIVGMENATIQLAASFIAVAVYKIIKEGIIIPIIPNEIPWILFLGLVNSGLGCYLYFSPLDKLPVQTVAVCGYIEPLSAVVFSAIILHERMTPLQMAGVVCIIGGAMIGELLGKKNE